MASMASPRWVQSGLCLFLKHKRAQSSVLNIKSISRRNYGGLPLLYDAEDPAPLFFSSGAQERLKYITRPEPNKIFRKRNNRDEKEPPTPEYKFLTDAQLREEMEKARERSRAILQMPPIVKVHQHRDTVISKDPAIRGWDTSKYVFADITYGLNKNDRLVIVRDPDGTLKHADYDLKKRLIQTFVPMGHRQAKEPAMFAEDKHFNDVLERKEYEFILDRACIQYDPDEPAFQKANARVFQHCDVCADYDLLRSTRHFGPMAFYLSWHNSIDGLVLDMLNGAAIREATVLINLHRTIHPELTEKDETENLIAEILRTKDFWGKADPNRFGDEDIALDEQCLQSIGNYIKNNSTRKAKQELVHQTLLEMHRKRASTEKGIRAAHGAS